MEIYTKVFISDICGHSIKSRPLHCKDYKIDSVMTDDMSGFSKKPKLDPEDYYMSDEGYLVFTEKYLLKRGYCCQNGCRHCPYGFDINKGKRKSQ